MSRRDPRFAVVASTAGSVMNEVLKNDYFRSKVHSVVVDRDCAAIEKMRSHGVRTEAFMEVDEATFCRRLLAYLLENEIDYVFSYYTNFYAEPLRDAFRDRIVNFHPSLLPAFKGNDAFDDNVGYHARYVGNTVEFIAEVMDEGKIVMQTACPLDMNKPVEATRHRVFVQQCQALLQVAKWLDEGRISVHGRRVDVKGVKFDDLEFSPALDFKDAIELDPEVPPFLAHSRRSSFDRAEEYVR